MPLQCFCCTINLHSLSSVNYAGENSGSNHFWMLGGHPNYLVPNFHKSQTMFLRTLLIKGWYFLSTIKDTILKFAETKNHLLWRYKHLVISCIYVCLSLFSSQDIMFVYTLISTVSHSRLSWPLNTRKRGLKCVIMLAT